MDGNARTAAAPAIAPLAGFRVCVCACALFVTQPNTMNKVSAIVLKKAAAAVASRSHVTSSSLKNKNGYTPLAHCVRVRLDGQIRGKRDDG